MDELISGGRYPVSQTRLHSSVICFQVFVIHNFSVAISSLPLAFPHFISVITFSISDFTFVIYSIMYNNYMYFLYMWLTAIIIFILNLIIPNFKLYI